MVSHVLLTESLGNVQILLIRWPHPNQLRTDRYVRHPRRLLRPVLQSLEDVDPMSIVAAKVKEGNAPETLRGR